MHHTIQTFGEYINLLPLAVMGQVRRRMGDDGYDGVLNRRTELGKGWSVIIAAVAPLAAALWWIDGRIETHIARAIAQHQAVAAVHNENIERRIGILESFQHKGDRFTDQDGKDLRKWIETMMTDHEKRLDVLEKQ